MQTDVDSAVFPSVSEKLNPYLHSVSADTLERISIYASDLTEADNYEYPKISTSLEYIAF